jgi:hypothetical protein
LDLQDINWVFEVFAQTSAIRNGNGVESHLFWDEFSRSSIGKLYRSLPCLEDVFLLAPAAMLQDQAQVGGFMTRSLL